MSSPWTFAVGPGASQSAPQPERELTEARGRTVTWRTRGHGTAQFTIDARSEEAQEIGELDTDLWVWRAGELLYRGRITTLADDITEDRHDLNVTAIDYRGMCRHRTLWTAGYTAANKAQAEIAWEMLNASQGRDGGSWGVTQGLSPAGTPRDRNENPMTNLADAMTRLSEVDGGFEWEISPNLELDIWTPRRGADNGVVLDFGGTIARLSGTLESGRFANAVGVTGAKTTTPAVAVAADVASDPRGRWERVESFPNVEEQSTLDERPDQLLDDALRLSSPLTATFTADRWEGPSHVWLGDIVTVNVQSGRFGALTQRVMEVQVSPGDDGTETVRLGLVPWTS